MIERNVTFDESAMLSPREEKVISSDAGPSGNSMKQVEFESGGSTIVKHSSQQQQQMTDSAQVEETPQMQ